MTGTNPETTAQVSDSDEQTVAQTEQKSSENQQNQIDQQKAETQVERVSVGDESVVELLDRIVWEALKSKASDVHIEPREKDVVVRYRVDGMLREVLTIDKNMEQGLVFRIKVAAKLLTDQHFAPQDGRIRFIFEDKKLDTRISILPTSKGEKTVIRLLTQEGKSFALEDLGLKDRQLEIMQKAYIKPYGMILATGPTGSGKTTTLYSILKIINTREKNITTIEDPVEYDIEGVNHVQINVKANLTFANGLRSILRQDPDIVMVGEIRDSETAKIAINSAMTGHLVLSTLHTNDAITTIPRLFDMGVEAFLVASTLNVVVAQRLARKLCEKCRQTFRLTDADYNKIKSIRPDIAKLIKIGETYYKENKCEECNTGYKGRIGIYEILEVTEAIREIIARVSNADEIFNAARKEGMELMIEDGVKKVAAGVTSLSELIRITALKE